MQQTPGKNKKAKSDPFGIELLLEKPRDYFLSPFAGWRDALSRLSQPLIVGLLLVVGVVATAVVFASAFVSLLTRGVSGVVSGINSLWSTSKGEGKESPEHSLGSDDDLSDDEEEKAEQELGKSSVVAMSKALGSPKSDASDDKSNDVVNSQSSTPEMVAKITHNSPVVSPTVLQDSRDNEGDQTVVMSSSPAR